jgi:selenocysteine lyase/cysteine desulfurase
VQEDVLPELASAVAAVAHRSGADPADCFPTSSPADALTALLHTIKPFPDASVLILSAADRVTKAAVGRCAATAGLSIIEVQINKDVLLDVSFLERQMESALKAAGGAVKAAVIPHVPSFPPVVLPVADLVAKCKEVCGVLCSSGTVPSTVLPHCHDVQLWQLRPFLA